MSAYTNVVPLQGIVQQQNLTGFQNTQQARINKVLELFNYAMRKRQVQHPRWKENMEIYLSIDRELKARPKHASKLFIPRGYLVVETKVPKIAKSTLRNDFFKIFPRGADDLIRARTSQELLNYYWQQQDDGVIEVVTGYRTCSILGNSIGKTGWEYKEEYSPQRRIGNAFVDPISLQLIVPEFVEGQWSVVKDMPFYRNVNIGNFYPDPEAKNIESCKYMIEQVVIPRHELEQMERLGVYQNVGMIQKQGLPAPAGEFKNEIFTMNGVGLTYTNNTDNQNGMNPEYDNIELLVCWWIDNGIKMKTVVANRQVVIQDIPFPYWHQRWPYYRFTDTPFDNEFWSYGVIDPMKDLQKELNELRNQQADNRNQFLKALWYVNRASNIDVNQLRDAPPGGIIQGTGPAKEALEILRPPPLDNMTFAGQQQVDSDIQMTTGANDIAIGTPTRSQVRTATTGSLMAESVADRYSLTGVQYANEYRKIGRDMLRLANQFMSQPVAVRILGMDGLNFNEIQAHPADIPHNFDIEVVLGADLKGDQSLYQQQQLQLFQIMAGVPGYQITEGAKDLLRAFDIKNPERYFEGNTTVPTYELMKAFGQGQGNGNPIQSNFLEVMGGFRGGGTQQPRVNPGLDRAGLLETSQNPTVTPNVA